MITISAYIESLLQGEERFRTLRRFHPVADNRGQPLFLVSGDTVRFCIVHEGRTKSLRCTLKPQTELAAADCDRILNITNRHNPYISPCEVLKSEMLAFDTAGRPRWNDVILCSRPDGVLLPAFVRTNLNRSDRRPLRELLRNIAAMAESLASDNITHGNLKPENIYVMPDGKPCAVDFAIGPSRSSRSDDVAFGLLALNVYLLGCEPQLYSLQGGVEIFRPTQYHIKERHIRVQAEFSKLRPVTDLACLLSNRNPAASREELCRILNRLSTTPFEPMPLLIGLLSSDGTPEAPTINGVQSVQYGMAPPRKEDASMRVDFSRCEFVGDISDTLIRFKLNGKWGFADRYGRRLTDEEYLSAEDYYEGRAKVETPSGCGMTDRAGEYVMPPIYEMLEWHGEENVATACRDGKWELYDRNGRALTAAAYDWIGGAAEGALIVRRGNKFGFITSDGKPLTDIRYDEAYSFRNGSALVLLGGARHKITIDNGQLTMTY